MRSPWTVPLIMVATLTAGLGTRATRGQTPESPRKMAVVELFTSHGWDLCPSAEQLLGQLSDLGYGPDRVATLALHVDYFNDPWKDPFSDPQFSRREAEYSRIYHGINKNTKPDVLYLTPLMMVDGRFPLLGSGPESKAKLRAALDKALREKPEVSLDLSLKDAGAGPDRKALAVTVRARSSKVADREMLIGVAIYEDLVSTRVESGELAGKTYVNHNVVRKLAVQPVRPRAKGATLDFPVELAEGWDPEKCGLTVFAQDEQSGRIYQAATLRWKARAVSAP